MYRIRYDDGDVECLPLGDTTCDLTSFGPSDVGRRIAVHWEYKVSRQTTDGRKQHCNDPKGRWHFGQVVSAEGKRWTEPVNYFVSDAALVKYDDGDEEILDLEKECWRFVCARIVIN